MKKFILFLLVFSLPALIFLKSPQHASAQLPQSWETIVGQPVLEGNRNEDTSREGGNGGNGGSDGLGPGEFQIPWRCWLNYWSLTYGEFPSGLGPHSAFSIDVNRGSGDDDKGDPVLASADGSVVDFDPDYGTIVIKHEGGYYTSYTHTQNKTVKIGDFVSLGQKIAEIGATYPPSKGKISPHLHVNHAKGGYGEEDRIQVCYIRYGCDRNSVNPGRFGIVEKYYNKGCP